MIKIKDLYKYSKDNSSTLLFNANSVIYPTIEGNTSNFITDYVANSEALDRMFWVRYSSMKPVLPEEDTLAENFLLWKDACKSVLYFYLESWARLYYALSEDYQPLWNVDGITTTRTQGKTEGLSGTDTTTYNRDQHVKTEVHGAKGTTDTSYEVPFDNTTEKEVGKSVASDDQYTDTYTEQANIDTDTLAHGRQNNVDYTVTETRGGNIGLTSSMQLLEQEFELRKKAFWDNVFKAICKELLFW